MKLTPAQERAFNSLPVEIWRDILRSGYSIKRVDGEWLDGMRETTFMALIHKGAATCEKVGPRCRVIRAST